MLDDLSIIDISLLAAYMQHECLNVEEALSPFLVISVTLETTASQKL